MTPADVRATIDVMTDVGESSDSLNPVDALEMLEAVQEVMKSVRETAGLLESQLVAVLESPREFNGTLYEIVPNGKWRPDHSKVQAKVKQHSLVDTETGELRSKDQAVERAISLMHGCYVSPNGMPKVGGLDTVGLDKSDVAHYERAGKKGRTTPVVPEP